MADQGHCQRRCSTIIYMCWVQSDVTRWQQGPFANLHSRGTAPRAESHFAFVAQVAGGYRRPLPEYLPEALREIINKCWAQNSRQRPDISDVVDRLTALRKPRQPAAANGAHREERETPAQQKACCVVM